MLVIKINGKVHYINMGHVIEIYESEERWFSALDDTKAVIHSLLNIKLVDGSVLTVSDKEEQEDLRNFLECGFERGEA